MDAFERWIEGLDWGEETLIEQRERLVKLVLSPEKLKERERIANLNVTKDPQQLKLF